MGGFKDPLGIIGGGDDAGDASRQAAATQAASQQAALDYIKQREEIPQELREASLRSLGAEFGLPGYEQYQQDLVGQAERSPIFLAMQDRIRMGLEDEQSAAGRQASAAGMLRSGNLTEMLADQQRRAGVDEATALANIYSQRLGGIQSLANLPSYAPQIAGMQSDIGRTQAQGIIGAAQSEQAGQQAGIGNFMGLANLGMQAYSTFSDLRLKSDVKFEGEVEGHKWYSWVWNEEAEKLGFSGYGEGVMAHEVHDYCPEAIGAKDGYMTVDYLKLRMH